LHRKLPKVNRSGSPVTELNTLFVINLRLRASRVRE